jgi:PilZ domain
MNARRSTRVPIRIYVEVHGTGMSCDGETIVVNMHGALVRTSIPLEVGSVITIHVHLTGKSVGGRVVFAVPERPLEFGIAFDDPQNIWGIPLPPVDWRDA